MISKRHYTFTGFLLFLVSFNALSLELEIANTIISNQFPSYRLAIEEYFKGDADYSAWNKSEHAVGINLSPQVGDLNGDSIPDLLLVALSKNSFNKNILSNGKIIKAYNAKHVLVLACHGTGDSSHQCTIIAELDTLYPVSWLFKPRIVDAKGTHCEIEKKTILNYAIDLNSVLGSVYTLYWFDGKKYQGCVFGD